MVRNTASHVVSMTFGFLQSQPLAVQNARHVFAERVSPTPGWDAVQSTIMALEGVSWILASRPITARTLAARDLASRTLASFGTWVFGS